MRTWGKFGRTRGMLAVISKKPKQATTAMASVMPKESGVNGGAGMAAPQGYSGQTGNAGTMMGMQ